MKKIIFSLLGIVILISVFLFYKSTKEVAVCTEESGIQYVNAAQAQDYFSKSSGGFVAFIGKQDVTEEMVNQVMDTLLLEWMAPFFGYSLVDRSYLMISVSNNLHVISLDQQEIESLLTSVLQKIHLEDATFKFKIDTKVITLLFSRILTVDEKLSFEQNLVKSLTQQGGTPKFSWSKISADRYGKIIVPVGEEEKYIETLNDLDLFECVSREYSTITIGLP